MRKIVAIAALGIALLVPSVAPAQAQVGPDLGIGEAKSALGRELHRSFKYGAETGSLLAYCSNRSRSLVRCDVLFTDWDGDQWCGGARVRETRRSYYVSWNVSTRNCHLF
jgi:hypothetical protein